MRKVLLLGSCLFAIAALSADSVHAAETRQMRSFSVQVQGRGTPVILIPGLSCTAEVWNETAAHLNSAGYETHALSIAGFGGSPPIKVDDLLAAVRDDVAAYVKQYNLSRPVIIGHSLGGFLALSVAIAYPDLPSKVMPVDGLPYLAGIMMPGAPPEQVAKQAEAMRQAISAGPQSQADAMTRQSDEAMITSPANIEREFAVNQKSDRATVGEAMRELLTADLRPNLKKIKVPVLEIGTWIAYKQFGATHDSALANYRSQFANLPTARVIMSDDAKHFVMLDAPDWFYKQVDDFLKEA